MTTTTAAKRTLLTFVLAAAAWLTGPAAGAQENYGMTVSVMGGVGGSIDEDEAGFGNSAYQLGLNVVTDTRVRVGVRYGHLELDELEGFGLLRGPSVDYLVVAGEYSYPESYYESGMFAGLGAYRIDGTLAGVAEEETAAGLALGVNGDFSITPRVSILGELSVHYLLSDYVEFLATAFAGIGVHF